MQKSRAMSWRKLGDSAGGSELAETAMILPILLQQAKEFLLESAALFQAPASIAASHDKVAG